MKHFRPLALRSREAIVKVVEVARPLGELETTRERIDADLASLRAAGILVYTVGIDLAADRVHVTVRDDTMYVRSEFADRYGNGVLVVAGEAPTPTCSGRGNCANPLKGGLNINRANANCSSGFVAKASSNYYLLTAGHCGQLDSIWYHNNSQIGTIQKRTYSDGGFADAAGIKINAGQKSNLVFHGSLTAFFAVIGADNSTGVGDVFCLSARYVSSYDCGYVTDVSETVCNNDPAQGDPCIYDYTIADAIEAQGGSSGGAIFTPPASSNVYAKGIQSGIVVGDPDKIYFTKIDNIEWQLGVSLCASAAC